MRNPQTAVAIAIAISVAAATPGPRAQEADFYKGRTINLYIGFSAGGYDLYGRIVGRHIGKHIPGKPDVVAQNMPGAGSIKLAHWLMEAAPKDGTAFGIIDRGMFITPLVDPAQLKLDFSAYSWVGSVAQETLLCVSRKEARVKTFADLREHELVAGGLSKGDISYTSAAVIKNMYGAKLRFVGGYPGGNDITLALERGEVDGRCAWSLSSVRSSRPSWLTDGSINLLVQYTMTRNPELPDTPSLAEFSDEKQKAIVRFLYAPEAIARPFAAPPGVPAARLKILRDAFMATMKDPDFLAEAQKTGLDVAPTSGADLAATLKQIYATPPELIAQAKDVVK